MAWVAKVSAVILRYRKYNIFVGIYLLFICWNEGEAKMRIRIGCAEERRGEDRRGGERRGDSH